jgi:two-component system response regulator MprA
MTPRILVIEDDPDLVEFLKTVLREHDFFVKTAGKASEAMNVIERFEPDLTLLDLGLPDIDGQALCRDLKKRFPDSPIIILTAQDDVNAKVKSFDRGADDYITKPFEPDELIARIKARLRKDKRQEELKVGDLTLNPKTIEVKRAGKEVALTPLEFKLLEYLMTNRGEVLSRDMILNRIWLYSEDVDTRVVDVYIGYLRRKIDKGNKVKLIHSVRGFGYTIKAE